MDEDETIAKLERDLKQARDLLWSWRDKHGGKEHHTFVGLDGSKAVSPTDLIRDTNAFLRLK